MAEFNARCFRGRQSARGKAECQAVSFHPEDDSLETVVNLEKSDILQQLQAESPLCQVFFILFLAPGFFLTFKNFESFYLSLFVFIWLYTSLFDFICLDLSLFVLKRLYLSLFVCIYL